MCGTSVEHIWGGTVPAHDRSLTITLDPGVWLQNSAVPGRFGGGAAVAGTLIDIARYEHRQRINRRYRMADNGR